jgi:high-affinity iron transporter
MILSGAGAKLFLAVTLIGAQQQQAPAQGDVAPVARRVAATAMLATQEYRLGVQNGKVVAKPEVEEAHLFLTEAKRSAALLPLETSHGAVATLDSLIGLVDATASPDLLEQRVRAFTTGLAQRLNVVLDEIPADAPSLARGAQVYRENCASCHGSTGRGDGPMAARLDPKPADLSNAAELRDVTPLDYFRRISIGVVGTAMPAFETRLSQDDRWAAAAYATLLRLPKPSGDVPRALHSFATTAKMSDAEILTVLARPGGTPSNASLARVAAVRSVQPQVDEAATARVFARVRHQLDSAYALARTGDGPAASATAMDAYMTFEQVERSVRTRNPELASALEADFATLRARAGSATPAELESIRGKLAASLENAERTLGETLSPLNLFFQSFIILVREGLEAILVLGALMTFLAKTGASQRKRDIHIGVGAAVAASLLTAFALETIFRITPGKREALEGGTMLVATVVLFYVSYWLLSKMEVAKWNHFVKGKVQDAVTSGSALALASAAFLAVYREGFETVLFYKALFVAGGTGGSSLAIVAGILIGSIVMVGVYIAINRFGVRIPLKPFFGVTSAFLYYMAFVFAGKGVADLQEGGTIPTTVVEWAPRLPALGIYPTVESMLAQGALVVLALVALVWTFWIEPRRLRITRVMVPEPQPAGAPAAPARPKPATTPAQFSASGALHELQRSLERMEADLAEMRAEVERMRGYLASLRSETLSRGR